MTDTRDEPVRTALHALGQVNLMVEKFVPNAQQFDGYFTVLRKVVNEHYTTSAPVPLILHCPMCNTRHIDEPPFDTKPHHTHACQGCGNVWRPAIVHTVGVQFLPGFKNP